MVKGVFKASTSIRFILVFSLKIHRVADLTRLGIEL